MKWEPTHVLAYEEKGRMVEVTVRRDGAALSTEAEWRAHSVPDWTFEEDGRLYLWGEDFSETEGKCSLRPVGQPRMRLDTLIGFVQRGEHDVAQLSYLMQRSVEEVETGIATLERLGKVTREEVGRVVPVWAEARRGRGR